MRPSVTSDQPDHTKRQEIRRDPSVNITRTSRIAGFAAIVAVSTLTLSACAANEGAAPEPTSTLAGALVGAGASSQGAAQEAWTAAFQTSNPGVTITYDPSGSGAGRKTFISGGSDFAGSDSYFNDEELASTFAACAPGTTAFEVPAYISPIAVIFNVEGEI